MVNINSKCDTFIHFTIKFNSKDYQISIFQEFKKIFNNLFFLENSIQKSKFGFIQFNKIYIQLENQGIVHH